MAQVKKLQSGGSTALNLDDALNQELSLYNIKGKDERKIRDALAKLRDYAQANKDSFTVDPVAKRFKVVGENAESFEGSPDDIRSNWFTGKLKVENDEDAMSVAAAIYSNALQKINKAPTPTDKSKLSIGNIRNYVINDVYGTPEAFQQDFGVIRSDDERKKRVLQYAADYMDKYIKDAELNKDSVEYKDLEEIKNLRKTFNSQDLAFWDPVLRGTYKFKWNLNEFLTTKEDRDTWNAQVQAGQTKAAEDEKTRIIGDWNKRGLQINLGTQLWDLGYRKLVDEINLPELTPEQNKAMTKYIKDKKGLIALDEANRYFVFNTAGQPINTEGTDFNQFHPLYGKGWNSDVNTGLSLIKGKYDLANELGEVGESGIGLDLPQYPGWVATGWSRDKKTNKIYTDILGNRDYTKYIQLTKPTGERIILTRNNDGSYNSSEGRAIKNLEILGYKVSKDEYGNIQYKEDGRPLNPFNMEVKDLAIPSTFNSLETPKSFVMTDEDTKSTAELYRNKLTDPNAEIDGNDKANIRALAKQLKFIAKYSKDEEAKKEALRALIELDQLLEQAQISINKKGGILKAQLGLKLGQNAKLKDVSYDTPQAQQQQLQQNAGKPRDISNLVRGSSNLDKAALALNAGSLAPGIIGSISALGALGVEAYQGAQDGWDLKDTGNLALNIGLVGASFIGLGGLRTVLKGKKLAQAALKIADSTTDISKAMKFASKEVDNAYSIVNSFAKEKNLTNLKKLEDLAVLEKNENVVQALGTITGFAEEVAKSPKLLPSLTNAGSTTLKVIDKASKFAAYGNAAMNLPGAIQATKKILSGDVRDLSLQDVQSLTSVAFGAKVAKHATRQKIATKYGTTPATNTPNSLTAEINGKKITITDPDLISDFNKFKVLPGSKKNTKEAVQKAFLKEYNKDLPTEQHIKLEDLKDLSPAFNKATQADFEVRENYDLGKNLYLQEKGIKWAKKYKLVPEKAKVETKKIETKAPDTKEVPEVVQEIKETTKSTKNISDTKYLKELSSNSPENRAGSAHKVKELKIKMDELRSKMDKFLKKMDEVNPNSTKVKDPKKAEQRKAKYFDEAAKLEAELIKKMKEIRILKNQKGGKVRKLNPGGSTNILTRDGLLSHLKSSGMFDTTNMANLAMYANTIAANRYIGNQQRQAIANSVYKLPTMPKNYIRVDKTNTLEADRQNAKMYSRANRMANATSDINKGMAVKLDAADKANEFSAKAFQADQARLDKLRNLQLENNTKIDQINLGVLGKNKAIVGEAAKNINLINANERNAQNTAFGNLTRAFEKNYNVSQLKNELELYNKDINDPNLKKKGEEYADLAGEKGRLAALAEYDKLKEANPTGEWGPFEESTIHKTWQDKIKTLEKEINLIMEPIRTRQNKIQTLQSLMFLKKGGSLSKEEKIEIENLKHRNRARMKEVELAYKAILHNNELLQKALIKVFK